jgi:citrate synthase
VSSELQKKLATKVESLRDEVRSILKTHGDHVISEVTISQAYGGMRGVKSIVTETSALDPDEGIRFRGYTIPELQKRLPRAPGGGQPLPEGLCHLLLTGELPTDADVEEIRAAWRAKETLPEDVPQILDAMPREPHPMTQFSIGILALQRESVFARQYREGMSKQDYWSVMFQDVMILLARLPVLAAYIYRRTYHDSRHLPAPDPSMDWAGALALRLGQDDPQFLELMRLYMTIHTDHEGGNVSAHTTHLVGSVLSDPYLALSAGMNGLAGPLHGLANQEVMRWIFELKKKIGERPDDEAIRKYVWDTLHSGRVVPGFGHAVLRRTDPRYMAQREFALEHLPEDENFAIVSKLYDIVPDILREQGKAKNPWPNVDAHSGCLLVHYGLDEADFYTVLFGVSRAIGVLSSLIWDRALGLPLERPKSVTTEWIKSQLTES